MAGAAVLLGLAALGCSDSPKTVRLDVYSWWDQPEEKVAFDTVARMHMERHENVDVRNLYKPNAEGSREELSTRMLAEAPPATFQANAGADLLRWAVFDTETDPNDEVLEPPDSSRSLLSPLDELFDDAGFTVPPEVAEQLRVEEGTGPFAVPLNIHRENILYYNAKRREDFERNTEKELLLLETLCPPGAADPSTPKLEAGIAIALGDPWPLTLLVFENILPALVAADPDENQNYYTELLQGARSGAAEGIPSERVDQALACAQYLSRSAVEGSLVMDWADTVRAVKENGSATFAVMGDWANPLLKDELASGEVVAVPFPGTEHIYVFTSDTFPLPIGVEYPEETLEFLKTFASEEGQIKFSREKGSIPARRGVGYDAPLGWGTSEKWDETEQKFLATSGHFPPYYPNSDLAENLKRMMGGEIEPNSRANALRFFTDSEPILTHWQDRLRLGLVPPRTR